MPNTPVDEATNILIMRRESELGTDGLAQVLLFEPDYLTGHVEKERPVEHVRN